MKKKIPKLNVNIVSIYNSKKDKALAKKLNDIIHNEEDLYRGVIKELVLLQTEFPLLYGFQIPVQYLNRILKAVIELRIKLLKQE